MSVDVDKTGCTSWNGSSQNKAADYRQERINYWNSYRRGRPGHYYHNEIARIYQFLVPVGHRVLELGCGEGDLLAALKPSRGVGVDFSPRMIAGAKLRYRNLSSSLAMPRSWRYK